MSNVDYISPTHVEWPRAWDALRDATGDYADCCAETGECWQYMGTATRDLPAIGENPLVAIVHQFRHRHRPWNVKQVKGFAGDSRGKRVYLDIAASLDYAPSNGVVAGQPVHVTVRAYGEPQTARVKT